MGDPYYDPSGATALFALIAILIPILLIVGLIFYVLYAFFLMRLFDKAGVEGKWRAWVPVYNTMILGKLGDVSPWVVLGVSVASAVLNQVAVLGPLVGLIAYVFPLTYYWRVLQKQDKQWYLLLLFLLPGIGQLIILGVLAFGSARWNPNIPASPWANTFLADKTVWQGIPVQPGALGGPAAAGYAAPGGPATPGAYGQPEGYQAPPQGYQAPPQGYQAPPQGYQAPPSGYAQPSTPPAPPASTPPAATPAPTTPPASTTPPAADPATEGDQPRP